MIDDLDFELNGEIGLSSVSPTTSKPTKPPPDFYHLTFETADSPSETELQRNEDVKNLQSEKRGSNVSRVSLPLYSLFSSDTHVVAGTSESRTAGQLGLIEVLNVYEFSRLLVGGEPRIAGQLSPGLPAFVIFGALRFGDYAEDDTRITELFNSIHSLLKEIAANSHDLDSLGLWLVNCWRLLNLLRQYSGETEEEGWHFMNTEKQNSWRLRNFNFEPIRNQLRLRVEEFYQLLMKNVLEPLLTPKISAAILQHEADHPQTDTGTPEQKGRRLSREASNESTVQSLENLKEFLNVIRVKLQNFGADDVVLGQVFSQMSRWICCSAMNTLVFRKDLCTFEKAIQIKHNVREIQTWFGAHDLGSCSELLEPLVQASHLMQSRKDESNLDALAGGLTSKLTTKQVVTLLYRYTPPPNFEEDQVSSEFVRKLEDRLNERAALADVNGPQGGSAIMHGSFVIKFNSQPFVYSEFALDELTVPSILRLDSVIRLT